MGSKAIVIGSGAGGLSAAAYLAKDGVDVQVLEQSDHLGGLIAPFERRGYRFDPGVHYLGMCRPGQMTHEVLAGLGIDASALFVELDPEGFDVFRFPGFEVSMPRGLDAFRDRLRARLPVDDWGLIEIFALTRALHELMVHSGQRMHFADVPFLDLGGLLRWSRSTFGDLLSHFLTDPRSIAALAAQAGDYGLPPSHASALGALSILAHYGDGAFFPRGGAGALRDALVAAGSKNGARYRTKAAVERILLRYHGVAGVALEGGEVVHADLVVSDVDPTVTFGRLLAGADLPARIRRKVARIEPSLGPFIVYLGMRRDVSRTGLGRFNVWTYPSLDVEAAYAPLAHGELPPERALFISSGSAKDDTGTLAPAGCSTVEIVTFVPHELFAPWEDPVSRRPWEDYVALQLSLEQRVLDETSRRFPGLIGDIEVMESSTPLALARWLRAVRGGAYGPAMTPAQWGPFRFGTRTPISGLFLAGAGVLGGGVAPSLVSGRLAARAAVGKHLLRAA